LVLPDRILEAVGAQAREPSGWLGRISGHFMAWEHRALTNWAIGFMDIRSTDHVLDVGCGPGMAIKLMSITTVDGFVAGVDHSEIMVQQALKRNAAFVQAGLVEIKHGDVSALPYDDESFDKIIAVETFYFWPEHVASLREVLRVMKPGGSMALAMAGSKESPNLDKHVVQADRMGFALYSGAEMERVLTAARFSQAWFESAPDKGWGWLCALGVK